MSSFVPVAHDTIVDLCTVALPTIDVVDGPPLANSGAPESAALYIGADPDDSTTTFVSTWAGQGSQRRDETLDIPCLLYTRSGDTDMRSLRASTFALYALVEAVFRPAADLGITGSVVRAQCGTSGTYQQSQTTQGAVARLSFVITVQARI